MTLSGFRAGFYPLLREERIVKNNDTLSLRKGEGKGEGFQVSELGLDNY